MWINVYSEYILCKAYSVQGISLEDRDLEVDRMVGSLYWGVFCSGYLHCLEWNCWQWVCVNSLEMLS